MADASPTTSEGLTSHALARRLLELPDLPVIAQNDAIRFRLVRAYAMDRASWSDVPGEWTEDQPAVVVADFTDTDWIETINAR